MMDLHDRLARIAGPATAPTDDQANADLARAKSARRRHTRQKAAGGAFAVAVAVAVAYGVTASPAASPHSPPVAAGAPAAAGQPIATKLVAYQGEQPKGFTVDKVPDGWEIQGGSPASLTVAPIDAVNKEPDSFVGKIAIMLQSKDDHSVPHGTAVKVAGRPAVLNSALDTDHGQNLWVKQPDGVWMLVQIWDARGWTQATIVEFAAGIHVLPGAVRGVG